MAEELADARAAVRELGARNRITYELSSHEPVRATVSSCRALERCADLEDTEKYPTDPERNSRGFQPSQRKLVRTGTGGVTSRRALSALVEVWDVKLGSRRALQWGLKPTDRLRRLCGRR